jgi:hypothetical protein
VVLRKLSQSEAVYVPRHNLQARGRSQYNYVSSTQPSTLSSLHSPPPFSLVESAKMPGTPPPGASLRQRSGKTNGKKLQADDLLAGDNAALSKAHVSTPVKRSQWDYRIALVIVTILAFVTRFWGISHPNSVVFDEVHFGKVSKAVRSLRSIWMLRQAIWKTCSDPLLTIIVCLVLPPKNLLFRWYVTSLAALRRSLPPQSTHLSANSSSLSSDGVSATLESFSSRALARATSRIKFRMSHTGLFPPSRAPLPFPQFSKS